MSFGYLDDAKKIIYKAPVMETVTIPTQAEEIYGKDNNDFAFKDTASVLLHVLFPPSCSLIRISACAFHGCSKLQDLDLTECKNLESIGDNAFAYCSALGSVIFPESKLKTIGNGCFLLCSSLKNVKIPASVTRINPNGFYKCQNLETFTFAEGSNITYFGDWSFYTCTKMKSFFIPEKLVKFQNLFNYECTQFTKYEVASTHAQCHSVGGVVYSLNDTVLYLFPPGLTGNYKMNEKVKYILAMAFSGSHLATLEMSPVLYEVGEYAFTRSYIKVCNFPATLKSVERFVFEQSFVEEVTFPNEVHHMNEAIFYNCTKLKKVTLPDKFTNYIGGGIFTLCPESLKIEFSPESDLHTLEQKLVYTRNNETIVMYFGNFEEVTIKNYVRTIRHMVFYKNPKLKRIVFEETSSLQNIEREAFYMTKIENIVFPDSLKGIGESAFHGSSLVTVEFGSGMTNIQGSAFSSCSNLNSIKFKSGGSCMIGNYAFMSCPQLATVDFSDSVTSIHSYAFTQDKQLTSITIPKNITTIANYAFASTGLTQVTFSEDSQITKFDDFAFSDCVGIKTFDFPPSLEHLGKYSMHNVGVSHVVLPVSLKIIDANCFNGCSDLTTFEIPSGSQLEDIRFYAFYGCFKFEKIICNSDNFALDNGALYNSTKTKLYVVPPNMDVKFFAFPPSLRTIGQCALLNCIHIMQIFIPSESVQVIENNVFEGCTNLISINIPLCVKEIGPSAFTNCSNIQCGLLIENRTDEFLKNLVETAYMPEICLKDCDDICPTIRKSRIYSTVSNLLIVSLFNLIA